MYFYSLILISIFNLISFLSLFYIFLVIYPYFILSILYCFVVSF